MSTIAPPLAEGTHSYPAVRRMRMQRSLRSAPASSALVVVGVGELEGAVVSSCGDVLDEDGDCGAGVECVQAARAKVSRRVRCIGCGLARAIRHGNDANSLARCNA